jgi:hypothetical protein
MLLCVTEKQMNLLLSFANTQNCSDYQVKDRHMSLCTITAVIFKIRSFLLNIWGNVREFVINILYLLLVVACYNDRIMNGPGIGAQQHGFC